MSKKIKQLKIREFTKGDWECYNGCERFADGSEPLWCEVSETILIVADNMGMQVEFFTPDEEGELNYGDPEVWMLPFDGSVNQAMARLIVAGVAEAARGRTARVSLTALGFCVQ